MLIRIVIKVLRIYQQIFSIGCDLGKYNCRGDGGRKYRVFGGEFRDLVGMEVCDWEGEGSKGELELKYRCLILVLKFVGFFK